MRIPSRVSQLLLPLVLAITAPTGYSQIADDSGQNGGGLSSQPGSAHSFSGAVVNSITRQPISRALVQAGAHAALTEKRSIPIVIHANDSFAKTVEVQLR